jgi:hypothetical protein
MIDKEIVMTRSSQTGAARGSASGRGMGPWLVWGLVAGFLAGVVFIALTAWFTASMGNPSLTPFRVIATIVQGPPPPEATIWVGMVIHSVLSALFGLVFAAGIATVRGRLSTAALLWGGLLYGALIYLVDFQLLARVVEQFFAFRGINQPFELTVHLVFGAVLAAFLAVGPGFRRRSTDASRVGEG